MHMISIRRAFAGIGTGLALLLAFNPPADATPDTATRTAVTDICTTGFRGQPDYDRHCLLTGHPADAEHVWKHAGYTRTERTAQCRTALRLGMPTVVRETRGDIITDTYRNTKAMSRWVAEAGARECFRIG